MAKSVRTPAYRKLLKALKPRKRPLKAKYYGNKR